jgi:hypothetical protein
LFVDESTNRETGYVAISSDEERGYSFIELSNASQTR